ncbi:pantoate--beta-alanine ligase [Desulfopila sp. IMCC35008]|uniref:pantoate--beta-alanine ligase n=1 Tax=Desulfopila sp. IMCC35008 TaxID=2653858 RepID=UPI0013D29BAE|nr:pantoate--beta-alanine ligase [Desulfopila sp. IMCC35008]
MILLSKISEIRSLVQEWRQKGESVGLVPTMGYLHEGHLSLMRCAQKECDRIVTSIFVNPMQFGPNEDLDNYPRSLERDRELAEKEGVDALFCPQDGEMYGSNYQTTVRVQKLSQGLCGADRPGHFDGVATVITKLFNIITPDAAIFGEKDFQQLALIRQLTLDLNFDIRIIGHPIVREADGLAMSSRNKYLSIEDRKIATCMYTALQKARVLYREKGEGMPSDEIEKLAKATIEANPQCAVEYTKVVHQLTLQSMEKVTDDSVLTLAMKVSGNVRLIDNGFLAL